MRTYDDGASVRVTDGPFKGIYGVVVYVDAERDLYLVRFNAQQQLYFEEQQIAPWS